MVNAFWSCLLWVEPGAGAICIRCEAKLLQRLGCLDVRVVENLKFDKAFPKQA
jgi:hypothetical protein